MTPAKVATGFAVVSLLLAGATNPLSAAETDPASVLTAPAAPGQAGAMLILEPDQAQSLGDGRRIVLTDLVEKRMVPDRRSMMRARFTISAEGAPDRNIELTSDDPRVEIDGAVIEYLGGWRSEARLRVTLTPTRKDSENGRRD